MPVTFRLSGNHTHLQKATIILTWMKQQKAYFIFTSLPLYRIHMFVCEAHENDWEQTSFNYRLPKWYTKIKRNKTRTVYHSSSCKRWKKELKQLFTKYAHNNCYLLECVQQIPSRTKTPNKNEVHIILVLSQRRKYKMEWKKSHNFIAQFVITV